jgi:hypothetical protein
MELDDFVDMAIVDVAMLKRKIKGRSDIPDEVKDTMNSMLDHKGMGLKGLV